jgi:hypothetical protein
VNAVAVHRNGSYASASILTSCSVRCNHAGSAEAQRAHGETKYRRPDGAICLAHIHGVGEGAGVAGAWAERRLRKQTPLDHLVLVFVSASRPTRARRARPRPRRILLREKSLRLISVFPLLRANGRPRRSLRLSDLCVRSFCSLMIPLSALVAESAQQRETIVLAPVRAGLDPISFPYLGTLEAT